MVGGGEQSLELEAPIIDEPSEHQNGLVDDNSVDDEGPISVETDEESAPDEESEPGEESEPEEGAAGAAATNAAPCDAAVTHDAIMLLNLLSPAGSAVSTVSTDAAGADAAGADVRRPSSTRCSPPTSPHLPQRVTSLLDPLADLRAQESCAVGIA